MVAKCACRIFQPYSRDRYTPNGESCLATEHERAALLNRCKGRIAMPLCLSSCGFGNPDCGDECALDQNDYATTNYREQLTSR